jgi:hypothetical protein
MLWTGAAQRHGSAIRVARYCFPSEDFRAHDLSELAEMLQLHVRIYTGLRDFARRISNDQVAEIVDQTRMRDWYQQCRPSKTGVVTLQALGNLLSDVGVVRAGDRRILRRLVMQMRKSTARRTADPFKAHHHAHLEDQTETKDICLGFSDVTRLFGRAVVAWTCYRGLQLCTEAQRPISTGKQWEELQRKIIVSLLVNHEFWGDRESQHVLVALGRELPDTGQDLAQLFQRALLPTGIEGTLQTEENEKGDDRREATTNLGGSDRGPLTLPQWMTASPNEGDGPSQGPNAEFEDCFGMYAGHVVANLPRDIDAGSQKSEEEGTDEQESSSDNTEEEEPEEVQDLSSKAV